MDALTYRPLDRTDAEAILQIRLAAEAAEPSDSHPDLAEVDDDLSQPGLDLAQGSVAVLAGEVLVGVGHAATRTAADRWTAYLSAWVTPEFRRHGIGREILRRLIDQSKTLHANDSPDLAAEMLIWIPHGRATATALAASAGFTVRRYFFEMRADLAVAGEPLAVTGDDLRIVSWAPQYDDGTRLAYNSAFADHWGSAPMDGPRWRWSFADSDFFQPAFSRLAVRGEEVVGFVLVEEFEGETLARGYRTGYISRVGSVRSIRGRGVAGALLTDSMAALALAGYRYAELSVDAESPTGAGRLYERLGFVLGHRDEVVGIDF